MVTANTMPQDIKTLAKQFIAPKAPKELSQNFKITDTIGIDEIISSLKRHYFTRPIWEGAISPEDYLASEEGRDDLLNHLEVRLDEFRQIVIPWLNDTKSLRGSSILEIGCGTGSSTVALAEQGARITAVDIDEESLAVANDRCRVYGLNVNFLKANGTEVYQLLKGQHFDFIIFFACLEHMTNDERLVALKDTWDMLPPGGLLCVVETPNRLWYFDSHTARLPFYMWLPDKLAYLYSRRSPLKPFSNSYLKYSEEGMLSFLRHGRGVSFHEFDLAIKNVKELNIVSCLPFFLRKNNFLRELWCRTKSDAYYESFLAKQAPGIHRAFFQPSLDLIIRKEAIRNMA
jgi:2-polyprenyl-3-methyl-5-hydroxy-6-metoxy-1,4-benzoquinol methylase